MTGTSLIVQANTWCRKPYQVFSVWFGVVAVCLLLCAQFAGTKTAAQFDPLEQSCAAAPSSSACDRSGEDPVLGDEGIILRAARIITTVTAVASVIVIVVAGITMIVSSGNSSQVQSSRDAIIYALVALVIAALGRGIIEFIIGQLV